MDTRPDIEYVYILAASHSGSTLLSMLLNAHPDVTTIGETAPGPMGDVDTYRCSCGKLIRDCQFWTNVTKRMQIEHPEFRIGDFGTKFEFPPSRLINRLLHIEHRGAVLEFFRDSILRLSPAWRNAQHEIATRCQDLVSAILDESGARIIIDSSKLAHRLKFLLRVREFNVKVIHLVRDGRAVALTYMKQDEFADSREPELRRGGRGMAAETTANSLPMEKAAREWRRCLEAAEHVLSGVDKSQWIQVKYEQLCDDTEGTLQKIHDFLGLDSPETAARFREVENHVIGNGMRLDSVSEVSLDDRWKAVLTARKLAAFDCEAGDMNRRYGYV